MDMDKWELAEVLRAFLVTGGNDDQHPVYKESVAAVGARIADTLERIADLLEKWGGTDVRG